MNPRLFHILNWRTRFLLPISTLVAVLFLSFYNRQVCPFLNGLDFIELIGNLLLVLLAQLGLREWLFYRAKPKAGLGFARQGYLLSVFTWLAAGAFASLFHYLKYPDFPLASHLKLLSSYWVIGAGVLAQLEYAILEQAERNFRGDTNRLNQNFLESVSRRILEGYFLFALAPVIVMLLVVYRYQIEGYFDLGVSLEITYIGLFCVFCALVVSTLYGRSLKTDTQRMTQCLRQIEQGSFDQQMQVIRSDEFGEMSQGINQMAKGLLQRERIKEAFGRFVDPLVAQAFIEKHINQDQALQLGGERRQVVVLMSDIRGFTPLSESMPAEDLIQLLNGYFERMVGAINRQGGVVDKFIGDAVMALFGLVDSEDNPAQQALRAAISMQEELKIYNQSLGQIELKTGIGIHCGEVVAGYLGCAQRLEFTVIGSVVNVAARIESQARGEKPPILFSQAVADQVKGSFNTAKVCQTELKGVAGSMMLYSLQDLVQP